MELKIFVRSPGRRRTRARDTRRVVSRLQVRRHDILHDELETAGFDLGTARRVLSLPQCQPSSDLGQVKFRNVGSGSTPSNQRPTLARG
jgi:hypothetical protein